MATIQAKEAPRRGAALPPAKRRRLSPGELFFRLRALIVLFALVAVFVMGIAIFHISREFDHIDTDQMDELTDWHQSEEGGNI